MASMPSCAPACPPGLPLPGVRGVHLADDVHIGRCRRPRRSASTTAILYVLLSIVSSLISPEVSLSSRRGWRSGPCGSPYRRKICMATRARFRNRPMSSSSVTPMPPCICTASLVTSFHQFIQAVPWPGWPAVVQLLRRLLHRQPCACSNTERHELDSSACMRAARCCSAWKLPMGAPNCSRSFR